MQVKQICFKPFAVILSVQGSVSGAYLKVAYAHYYDNCIMAHLNKKPSPSEELWLVGKDGQAVVVNNIFASALLKTVAGAGNCEPSNCIYVPDAPLPVLRRFCQLLHTGRSNIFSVVNF